MTDESTALARLQEYENGKYNVLHPIVEWVGGETASRDLAPTLAIVQIQPEKETYHDFRFAPKAWEKQNGDKVEGRHALTAAALNKIAQSAGIKWVPALTGVVEGPRSLGRHPVYGEMLYIRYRATGAIRQPNGEFQIEPAEKDINTLIEAEEMEETFQRALKAGRNVYRGKPQWTEEDIPDKVKQQLTQLKHFILGHAETKAKNKAIRRLLSLQQVYTDSEIAKPFVVPRLVYRPDATDPLQLERIQMEAGRANNELYGSSATEKDALASARELPAGPPAAASDSTANGSRAGEEGSSQAGGDGSEAPATGRRESRGGASAGREPANADAGSRESEAGASEPTSDGVPKSDPIIPEGKYAGERMSVVAETDPEYMRGVADTHSRKGMRELATAWIDYWHGQKNPRLV